MATMHRSPLLDAEQCRMVDDLCEQRGSIVPQYMQVFTHLARRHAGPWGSFLHGARSLTLYPIHSPAFAFECASDEEAAREDWEAVGIDMWRSVLTSTSEQPRERSACEYSRQPVHQTNR